MLLALIFGNVFGFFRIDGSRKTSATIGLIIGLLIAALIGPFFPKNAIYKSINFPPSSYMTQTVDRITDGEGNEVNFHLRILNDAGKLQYVDVAQKDIEFKFNKDAREREWHTINYSFKENWYWMWGLYYNPMTYYGAMLLDFEKDKFFVAGADEKID